MKPIRARLALTTFVVACSLGQPLSAAVFTWDPTTGDAAVLGGSGAWDAGLTGTPSWTQDTGATNVTWPDTGTDNDAVFGGTAGTATIASGGVAANDLTFNTVGYIVTGGTLTLNGTTNILSATTSSATPIVISSPLAGTNGFTKSGSGQLQLSGNNSALSGAITLPNVTGTNNSGLVLSGANAIGGITQININGTSGTDGQYLGLINATLGSGVTLNLSGQGGNAAPVGTLRAVASPAVVDGPVNLLTSNVRISSSGAGSEMRVNGKIDDGVNSFGISFRFGEGNGVYLTNPANDWGGDSILGQGILRAEPGAIPATSKIQVGPSGNAWFQTNGTLTRPLGITSGTGAIDLSNSTAGRVIGLGARGGALSVNFGGSAADVVWGSTAGFNPAIFGLNNSTADSQLTLVNPLDLNGANRVIQVDANNATLTGGLKNSATTAAGIRKLGAGTLTHDPGSTHTLTLQSLQTGAGTLEVKSGTITVSSGAATTYSAGMNGFTVVGGSTFRLSGGTVNAKAANYVFPSGNTSAGGGGNFILDSGTFDAGSVEILNAYGATGTTTINGGLLICGQFRVGQGTGTLNLNGGTLLANNLSSGGGTTNVNFNGGTLQAKVSTANFVPAALTNTVIRSGGAVIDSNGFNVTIAHALTEDTASTGGGLTKKGGGILDLTGTNTYTGTNLIQGGALRISSNAQLGASTAPVTIDGGQFGVSGTAITSLSSLGRTFTYNSGGFYVTDPTNVLDVDIPLTGAGSLSKSGPGTIKLSGANTFTGGISMGAGDNGWIEVDNAADLGVGPKIANLSGSQTSVGGFRLLNNVTVSGVDLNIAGRNVSAATQHVIVNVSGNNTWAGNINIVNTGGTYYLRSDSGRLELSGTLSNAQAASVGADTRAFNLEGAGDFLISGKVADGVNANRFTSLASNTTGTTTLSGTNTYTGTTSVNAGKLIINGNNSAATGAVSVNGSSTLGGTGTIGGAITVAATATIDPGVTTGTLTASGGVTVTGTLAVQVDGTAADRLNVGGALDISAATLAITTSGSGANQPVYILAKYGTLTGTSFANVTGLPSGYTLNYAYNDGSSTNNIALVGPVTSTPYSTWAGTTYGLTGGDALPGADPDGDGVKNIVEFALNGNPTSGSNNGLTSTLIQDASAPAGNELTYTIAVRDGATFTSGAGGSQTATVDGVVYTIQGSTDLTGFASAVSVVGSASDTAPGLPSLAGTAWEYRTFKLDASEGLPTKGFIRLKVETAP